MASSVAMDEKSRGLKNLCETFQHMDKQTIISVAQNFNFDMNMTANALIEMSHATAANSLQIRPLQNEKNSIQTYIDFNKYNQALAFIKRGYKILIIMRGLPGSGKSTLALQLLSDSYGKINQDEFIFSTDRYFWKSGHYKYNVQELSEAHAWNQRRCFASMKRGVSPIIIDNTNSELWEMKAYCVMATKFGYMIEVFESCTPWAYNAGTLAKKNSHGVEKSKIKYMLDHFQKNITPKVLYKEFQLSYEKKLPQYREYPPLNTPEPPINTFEQPKMYTHEPPNVPTNSWKPPQRAYSAAQMQLPGEYVHKFEMKHGESATANNISKFNKILPMSSAISDPSPVSSYTKYVQSVSPKQKSIDELLNISPDKEYNDPRTDDLISFINAHKPSVQTEESIKSTQIDQLSKQLQENSEMMAKMMDFITKKIQPMEEHTGDDTNITSTTESKMEVDSSSNTEYESNNLQDSTVTTYNQIKKKEDLEKENAELWEQFLKRNTTNALSKRKQSDIQSTTSSTVQSKSTLEKEKMLSDRMNLFLMDKTSPDEFEFIDMTELKNQNTRNEKSSVPKFERKAWGIPEEALVSWEMPITPSNDLTVTHTPTTVETREQGTSTTSTSLNYSKISQGNDTIKKKVEKTPQKKITFDKSSMTDEEELLMKIDLEIDEAVKKLSELFPNIPSESILDVYEKCGKDFYWTVDLLSNSPDFTISTQANQNISPEKQSPDTSFKFDLNDWNITPNTEEKTKEDIARKKEEDEEMQRLKKLDEEVQQLKKQQIKKQLETSVSIGKEHYSDHVWQLKNAKMGSSRTPPEMMTIDDDDENDAIYISDDDSNSDNECTENLVEVNLGNDLVNQLESMFGQLITDDKFKPVVHMPESLAKQLHALYLESICRQIENQSESITSQLKEDEDFAMKLQEEERRSIVGNNMDEIMDEELAMSLYRKDTELWKNLTPDTLALKLTKQKLYEAFPKIPHKILDELLAAHDNNYKETVNILISSTGENHISPTSRESILQPPISDNTLTELKLEEQYFNSKVTDEKEGEIRTAKYYRDEADQLMDRRRELMNKAKEHQQKRNYEVALYYSNLAEKALRKAELANQHATQRIIHENSSKLQDSDTLDLHYLYVKSAIATLDVFVDFQITNLKSTNKPQQYCYVITGRGNRSENGKSKLKPAVIKRLKKRNVGYSQINPGMLKIKILKNLPTTSDLEKSSTN